MLGNTMGSLSGRRTRVLAVALFVAATACGSDSDNPTADAAPGSDTGPRADARPPTGDAVSLRFAINGPDDHDYGQQLELPAAFGTGEFTFEVWIWLDDQYPVGDVSGGIDQLTNWSDVDLMPENGGSWWFKGNFLLDGHNNADFNQGTFSLQLYGGGRLRWTFGDGTRLWGVQAFPATTTASLLDGQWHYVALVRRFVGNDESSLEMFIDGVQIAATTSDVRTDMRQYWDDWSDFPLDEPGWFWGAEKQAAKDGGLSQYEDYKGYLDEMGFWSRAKTAAEIADIATSGTVTNTNGLVGHFTFSEGSGTQTCDRLAPTTCMQLFRMKPGHWTGENAPVSF